MTWEQMRAHLAAKGLSHAAIETFEERCEAASRYFAQKPPLSAKAIARVKKAMRLAAQPPKPKTKGKKANASPR